jgi:hypothetical protein
VGGYCGNTTDHCGVGCQAGFGNCTVASDVTSDGRCGSFNGKTCTGATFGNCCSAGGYCGSSTDHCGVGCQSTFGTCNSGTGNISTDGRCGANGKTCTESTFGTCCSSAGYCGDATDHCGAGCQVNFGTCTNTISTDGKCGTVNGRTCVGSGLGGCCSASGSCGNTPADCGQGW